MDGKNKVCGPGLEEVAQFDLDSKALQTQKL